MTHIVENIRALIIISIISGILTLLFESTRFKDKIKFLSGIIILTLLLRLLSPLITELKSLVNIFPDDSIGEESVMPDISDDAEESVITESARQMAIYIKSLVCGKYEIPNDDINVYVILEKSEDGINVKSVTVSVTETHICLSIEISEYVASLMGCVCTVIEL